MTKRGLPLEKKLLDKHKVKVLGIKGVLRETLSLNKQTY